MTGISAGEPDYPGAAADADFWMEEHPAQAGRTRLDLIGELDVAGTDQLHRRLEALAERDEPVLLDLRRLQFIDSTGLGELVRALSDARRDGRILEIDATLSPQVRQLIDLLELQVILWPAS